MIQNQKHARHFKSFRKTSFPYLEIVTTLDEMPRAKGPTTRAMARRIQEEWALNAHARPKMNFTWAKEDVKT